MLKLAAIENGRSREKERPCLRKKPLCLGAERRNFCWRYPAAV